MWFKDFQRCMNAIYLKQPFVTFTGIIDLLMDFCWRHTGNSLAQQKPSTTLPRGCRKECWHETQLALDFLENRDGKISLVDG